MTDHATTLASIAHLLAASGVGIDELSAYVAGTTDPDRPTVAEYVERLRPTLSKNSLRTWDTHFNRFIHGAPPVCDCLCAACLDVTDGCTCACTKCADQRIIVPARGDQPLTKDVFRSTDLEQFVEAARRLAAKRARTQNASPRRRDLAPKPENGFGAWQLAKDAICHVINRAVKDELLATNPAAGLANAPASPTSRRSLDADELAEVFRAAAWGGNDPDLDVLLLWFHYETGARREGAVNLRLRDLLDHSQEVRLDEKGGKVFTQPVSAELLEALREHAEERGGPACRSDAAEFDSASPVLWYLPKGDGTRRPLTVRRYDTLFQRIQRSVSFGDETPVTAHFLRHTAATTIERIASTQVARRFLRHADRTTTDVYTDAGRIELAKAVSIMTGRDHPLAD